MSVWQSVTASVFARALLGAAFFACALAAAAEAAPLARIEGVEDPALRRALYETIGETDEPAESRWRARERARQAAERIRRYLESRGYYAALVDARLGENDTSLVRVRPGVQFEFGAIEIEFDTPSPDTPRPGEDIREQLGLGEGEAALAQSVIDAEARVLAALRNNGWIYAEAGDRKIVVDHETKTARATFRFDTGPYVLFGPPQRAGGLAELDQVYIERLAPYEVGEPASRAQLDEYVSRLQSLNIVSLADVRVAPDSEDRQRPVDVRMEPRERHTLGLSASWSTDNGFGGAAEWTRRNMWQRDELLTVDLRAATLASGIEARLEFPNWKRYQQTLVLNAHALAERTDAFDQDSVGFSAGVSRVVTDALTISAGADVILARVEDARGERDLATFSFPLEAVYDARNAVLNPTDGIYADLRIRPGITTGDESTQYVRTVAEVRGYHGLSENLTLAGRVRMGALFGASAEAVPANQRFFAGGGGSVRGYEYQSISPPLLNVFTGRIEPFGGRSLLETSVEARYRYSERIGIVAFVDGGIAGRDITPRVEDMQYAFGVGARYFPGFGPIRVDVATPLNPRQEDDALHVYISIGQAF